MREKNVKKALAEIKEVFGEPRIYSTGICEQRRLGRDGWAISGLLAVTETHVVMMSKRIGGWDQRVIPLDRISAVTSRAGLLTSSVTVQTSSEEIEMKHLHLKKPELSKLVLALQGSPRF